MTSRIFDWKIIGALLLLAALGIAHVVRHPEILAHLSQPEKSTETASIIPALERIGTTDPVFKAESVFMERLNTREVLFAKNEHKHLAIASLTKLMTGLLLAEAGEPLALVLFSDHAKRVGASDDKRSDVPVGEKIKIEDVEKLLLVASDNDAAYAAAEFAGTAARAPGANSEERIVTFVNLMNQRAGGLGLTDTHFANPAGSDDPENYSTSADLARLADAIQKSHPELWAITRTVETFVFGSGGARYSVVNTDPLLGKFPAIYGTKTGFEDQAQGALLILYQLKRDDLVLMVILKSQDRFADGAAAIRWLEDNFAVPPAPHQ